MTIYKFYIIDHLHKMQRKQEHVYLEKENKLFFLNERDGANLVNLFASLLISLP